MMWTQSSSPTASNATHRVFANLLAKYTIVGSVTGDHSPEIRTCVTRTIAIDRVVLEGSDVPPVGTIIHLSIATLGAWPARISEHLSGGFAVVLEIGSSETGKLGRKLDWLRRLQNREAKNRRLHQRFAVPPMAVELLLEDGTRMPATLLDLSNSGVGVRTSARLPLDTRVEVNSVPASVARYFDAGMGLRFEEVHSIDELKQKLLSRPKS